MKKINSYSLILLFAITILISPSCKKHRENQIQGKWKRILIEDVNSPLKEEWTFREEGGTLKIHIDKGIGGNSFERNDSARYYINAKLRRTLIHVEDFRLLTEYNGDWQIVTIDKSTMMLVYNAPLTYVDEQATGGSNILTKGGLLYREFVKE
jgi:hypothetical protein